MQIFVTGVKIPGNPRKTFTLDYFKGNDTIRSLKLVICNKFNIPWEYIYLIFGCKTLNLERTLSDYNIVKECSIEVRFRHGNIPVRFC